MFFWPPTLAALDLRLLIRKGLFIGVEQYKSKTQIVVSEQV
jgi:hypothetical protein